MEDAMKRRSCFVYPQPKAKGNDNDVDEATARGFWEKAEEREDWGTMPRTMEQIQE